MRKPLFFFVLSAKNKWNCLVKVLSVNFIKWKALCMMIRLKKTWNQWYFLLIWNICYNKNRLLFQLVTVKIYTVIQTDYCFNWLRRKSTGSSHWEVFLEINRKHWKLIPLKGCARYIFASLFCMSKREHFRNKEKCFLFHFESCFHSWDNQVLTF